MLETCSHALIHVGVRWFWPCRGGGCARPRAVFECAVNQRLSSEVLDFYKWDPQCSAIGREPPCWSSYVLMRMWEGFHRLFGHVSSAVAVRVCALTHAFECAVNQSSGDSRLLSFMGGIHSAVPLGGPPCWDALIHVGFHWLWSCLGLVLAGSCAHVRSRTHAFACAVNQKVQVLPGWDPQCSAIGMLEMLPCTHICGLSLALVMSRTGSPR